MWFLSMAKYCFFSAALVSLSVYSHLTFLATVWRSRASADAEFIYYNNIYVKIFQLNNNRVKIQAKALSNS